MKPLYSFIRLSSAAILQRISACRLALDKSSLFVKFLAAVMVVFVLAPSSLFAANQTWTNTGSVSGNWSETTNWGGNVAPGADSGNSSTDVATFITSSGNYGTTIAPILIDTYLNIRGLTFNGSSGNYTIGTTSGNALHMSNATTILIGNGLITNNTTITINAPLLMYGGLTINNQAPNATNRFLIGGNISSATAGAKTLSINSVSASSTNVSEITGLISDGNGTVSVTQSTSGGLWRLLNDANSFTGNLSVQGGSVYVSSIGDRGVASAAGAGNIINFASTTSAGSLFYTGNAVTTNRTINMAGTTGGANIYANNASGLLRLTSNITVTGDGNKTLTLRGTGAGEVAGSIVNHASGNWTAVTKNDAGTWTLSGNNTYTGTTTVSAGALNIQHANALGATSGSTTVSSGAALQLQGGISIGAEALSLTGTGVSTTGALRNISGSNTYGGAITLAGATRINSDADLLTLSGGIGGTQNLTIGGAGNTTINSAIATSTGTLTKDGAGTLTLSGANSFTGGVTINNGTLQLGNAGALNSTAGSENAVTFGASSTGALTLNGNSIVIRSLNSNATPGTPVVQNANAAAATLTVGNSANAASSYAGVIQDGSGGGALSLTKNGTGTLTLNGSNTYTGTTTINAGMLTIQNNSALGTSAGGTVVGNGSALQLQNNITVTGEALTLSGGGNGTSATTGALRSSGDNTWTGNITIGLLSTRIASDAGLLTISGNINNAFSTVFQGNGNITVSGIISGAGGVTTSSVSSATSVLTLSGDNTFTGAMSITRGIVSVSSIKNFGVASGLGMGNGTSGTAILIGQTSSNGTLLYTGTGDTSNRTIQIGSNSATPASSDTGSATIQNDGSGALVFNAVNFNSQLTTATGNATNRSLTLSGSNTGSNTISGVIRDNIRSGTANGTAMIGLIKSGTGTWILSGANTYSGDTSINSGTLVFRNTAAKSANSTVTVAAAGTLGLGVGNASIDYSNNVADIFNNSGNGTFALAAASGIALDTTNGDFTLSSDLTAARALTKLGNNTLTLSGSNTYSGATTVNQGTLLLQNKATRAGGSLVTVAAAGTIGLGVGGGGVTDYSDTDVASLFNNTLSGFALDAVSGVAIDTTAGNFTQSSALTGTRALTKLGSNTLTLTGDNSYTGGTTVSAGALNIQHANALGTTAGSTTVSSGAALQLQGGITVGTEALSLTGTGVSADGALRNISGSNTYGGAITLAGATRVNSDADLLTLSGGIGGATQNLTIGGAGNTTINSAIATTTGTLTKDGAGTLILSGNNTYSGTTTVSAGTLQLGHANALGATTSGLVVNGTLDLNGNSITKSTLSGETGNISSISAATLTFNSTNSAIGTYNGTIGGDVALSITNSNNSGTSTVLTLGGSNTYTGNTTIYNSALAITNGAALGNSTVIVRKGGQSTAAYGGELRISNNITISNNMTLAGAGYGGYNGALRSTSGNNIVTGTITSSDTDTRIRADGGTLTLNGDIDLTAATAYTKLFQHNSGDIRLGGNITGSATQIAVFGGTSSYLITDRANAWGTTRSLYLGGGSNSTSYGRVDLNGFDQTVTSVTVTGNATTNDYFNNIITNRSGRLATLTINNSSSVTASNTFSGNLALTKVGSGTLTITGNNTYTGATTINAGTITLTGNISNSATTINNGGTLIGTGTAGAVTVNSGGFIGAGSAVATPGTLTVGDLTLNGGGGYTWDLGNVAGAAGTNWDLITATSTTIGADANNKFTIYLSGSGTGFSPGTNYAGWNILQWGTLNSAFDANAFRVNSDNFTGAAPTGTWTFNSTGGFLNLSYTAPAATGIWIAGAGNWNDTANWQGGTLPSNTSPLEFSGSGGVSTNDNLLNTVAGITFTSSANASYTLNGTALTTRAGGIINNSTSAQTVAMDITMADSQAFNAGAANLTVSGAIANAGFNLEASGNNTVAISGNISGSGGLAKIGNGTLVLSGSNSYTGATTVSAGALNIQNNNALGTTAGGTTVASGAALQLQGDITVGAEALSLTGTGVSSTGVLRNMSGNNTYGGDITLFSSPRIQAETGSTLNLTGNLSTTQSITFGGNGNINLTGNMSGAGGNINFRGTGILTLSGNNTFTGSLAVGGSSSSGAVSISSIGNVGEASAVGAGTTITLGEGSAGGTLIYTGSAATSNKTINLRPDGSQYNLTLTQNGTRAISPDLGMNF